MTDRQRPWVELHRAHRSMRSVSDTLDRDLRRLLTELVARGHCDGTVPHSFSDSAGQDGTRVWRRSGPFELRELPTLTDAKLAVMMKTSRRRNHLHQFTVSVDGTTPAGATWVVAVDLDDDLKGPHMAAGACGHASLHCHVGPTRVTPPEVRVPFPAVGPVGALDWVLSQVIPGWEPAPWADVVALLDAAR